MALTTMSIPATSTEPKKDGRSNRLGRYEIVIRDLLDPVGKKYGTSYHARWRADGNLRIRWSSEPMTSKRNALAVVEQEPGVREVTPYEGDNNKLAASICDGTYRDVLVVDERDPEVERVPL